MPISTIDLGHGGLDNPVDGALTKKIASYAPYRAPVAPTAPCLITDFFEYQTHVQPDAPAVQFESKAAVTYADLGHLSQRLAHVLSIPKGTVVPICMDVSVDFIAAILAVLRSGASYVILDPNGPTGRNKRIIESCSACVVVVDDAYASLYPCTVVFKTALSWVIPKTARGPHAVDLHATDPAYVIYTSGRSTSVLLGRPQIPLTSFTGATGTPKGVIHTHAAASHGINASSLSKGSRTLLFYNPVFSAAQRTILATLSKGACLCLATREKLATSLPEMIQEMQVDFLGLTPSALSLLSPSTMPQCLKQIITVGEPLSQKAVDEWAERVKLTVSYGLSECAQLNFARRLRIGDNPRVIGCPSDTTQAFILEPDNLAPVKAGNPGELCLAGPQVAEGYFQSSQGTSSPFLEDFLGYTKVFRTGDRAIKHPDGNFEILGRLDSQVKIHGQRLEPEEVTAILSKNPFVTAVAVVGTQIKQKMSLVAVIVPKEPKDWTAIIQSLRQQVQTMLPSYMIPNYWVRIEKLPVNANSKIDLTRIRQFVQGIGVEEMLGQSNGDMDISDHQWNSLEITIRDAWAKILQLNSSVITPSSSFIALGGSSMDAIQVVHELRSQGLETSLGDILLNQKLSEMKVKSLSEVVDKRVKAVDAPRLSLIQDPELRGELEKQKDVVDAYPTTPLQSSLLASTFQGNPEYLYQRTFDVRHLDIVKMRLAFQIVFSASEILRTTYTHTAKGFVQIIHSGTNLPWTDTSTALETFISEDKKRGFVVNEPFVRFAIIQKQLLVVSMHHSLFDFWSHSFLYEDVARLYLGIESITRPPFREFVHYLQQLDLKPAKAYWKTYLEHSEPTILNHSPSTRIVEKKKHVSLNVKDAMRALGVTSGALLYTAWALVLARHTGSKEPVFATTIAGRELPVDNIHLLDGPTLTVIPQKVLIEPNASIAQTVRQTQSTFWDVLKNSQYGLRESLIASNQQQNLLLDTLVNILVKENGETRYAEGVFLPHGPDPSWRTDFTSLDVEEHADGFSFRLVSSMPQRRVDFILEQLTATVRSMLADFDAPLHSLDILGRAEQQWLTSSPSYAQGTPHTLHSRFEALVERHPENIALQWQNQKSFTYQQLDGWANQMAFFLNRAGVKRGDVVPILMAKSPEMITAIIAILKVGAAYVPLSPDNPVDRNLFIIHETKAGLTLTDSAHEDYFPNKEVAAISLGRLDLSTLPTQRISESVSPDQLAYIIYTSGSTGEPKGVMVKHRSAAAAIQSIIAFEGREHSNGRTLQFSNYVFDAFVYDVFVPLGCGHTLCMAPTDRLLSELAIVINEMEVNHCFLTPTVARLLNPKSVPTLQVLTVGGESVGADVVEAWSEDRTLILAYGPTETSIMVTMTFASKNTNPRIIGRPFSTVKALVVEPDGQRLVPWGALGELCVQGAQLGEGYLGKPKQTAAAFLDGGIVDGSRTYRTGDLCRWLPTGQLEYLGRKDNQVKINGHRIELGEIETAMMKASCIADVALVVDDHKTKPQLVAFAVFVTATIRRPQSLSDFPEQHKDVKLSLGRLAHYMVPKFVIPLDRMPLLPSGKTNRKELKKISGSLDPVQLSQYALDSSRNEGGTEVPETVEQKILHQAWAHVLGVASDRIGLEANFLSLGGDSITAINLASYLRRQGYALSVGEALGSTALKDMATCVRQLDVQEAQDRQLFEPPHQIRMALNSYGVQKAEYEYIYPCPPGQAQFLSQGSKKEQNWVVMIARKLTQSDNIDAWISKAKLLAQTNDILRTTFVRHEDGWYGAVLTDPTPIVNEKTISSPEERKEILEKVWQSRFTPGQPFLSYTLLRMTDGSCEIVIKMDHGLYDGTLLRVFDDHFRAFHQDQPVPEFTPFHQFASHIWSSDRKRSLRFWTEQDQRPTGFRYPNIKSPTITNTKVLPIDLPVDVYAASVGQTPSVVFQAAFQIWLAVRSRCADVSFDYLYTGRNVNIANPQSINGTCANFLPLRSSVDVERSVKEYLSDTNMSFWKATENGNVGLEDIYRACGQKPDDVGNTSLFLFQPFEPPRTEDLDDMRWVVMAKSEVKMPQPYAVVCEVMKTNNGYKIKFAYDERAFDEKAAAGSIVELESILRSLTEIKSMETRIRTVVANVEKD